MTSKLSIPFFEMLNHELANTANGVISIAQLMIDEQSLSSFDIVELGQDLSDISHKNMRLLARLKVLTQPQHHTEKQSLNLEQSLPGILKKFDLLPPKLSVSTVLSSYDRVNTHLHVFEVLCDTLISVLIYNSDDLFLNEQTLRIDANDALNKGLRFYCSNTYPLASLNDLNHSHKKLSSRHAFNLQTLYYLRELYDLVFLSTQLDAGFLLTVQFPNHVDPNPP
jgi:hypothetical protein